jgi:hypothetical protein
MQTFRQFINESREELEALKYLREIGLIGATEFVKSVFELDSSLVGVAEIEWTVDWTWASQSEPSDLEKILHNWFSNQGDPLPTGVVLQLDSLDIDQWTETDFWEEEEPDEEEEEEEDDDEEDDDEEEEREINMIPIYGFSPRVRITVIFVKGVDESSIKEWADGWQGNILEGDSDVYIEEEPKI